MKILKDINDVNFTDVDVHGTVMQLVGMLVQFVKTQIVVE